MLALMLVLVGASKWLMGAPAQAVVPIDVAKAIGVLELIAGAVCLGCGVSGEMHLWLAGQQVG